MGHQTRRKVRSKLRETPACVFIFKRGYIIIITDVCTYMTHKLQKVFMVHMCMERAVKSRRTTSSLV